MSRASSILSYAVLLGGVLTIGFALYTVVVSYSCLPYIDQWIEIQFASTGGNLLSPTWLWERWLEHRLVIPKLFLAADLRLFKGRQIFLLCSIFGIQLLHLTLLSWSTRVLGGWRAALWRTGTGLAAFCLFCPTQWQNFIWGFQVCFVLPQLLATASFVALLLYWTKSEQHPEKSWVGFLVLSMLSALGATCSLASGNLLWPILILAAIYLHLRRGVVLSFVLVGVISTGLYSYHFVRPGHHPRPITSNMVAPLRLLRFCAEYLFGAWVHRGVYVTTLIVLAGLALAVVVLFPALAYIRNFRLFGTQLVLMMMFWGATAMITAAGRAHFGTWAANLSRYQTVVLLFWCAVGLLLLGASFYSSGRMRYGFLVAQVCLLAIFLRGAATASHPIRQARQHGFALNAAGASLLTGVYDPVQLNKPWPYALDSLLSWARYLEANDLSVFAGTARLELGKPLEDVFPVTSSGDCTGAVESVAPIVEPRGPGLRVAGWAWDVKHQRPPSAIVVTTNGIITGIGAVGGWRPGVAPLQPRISSGYIEYIAYHPQIRGITIINLFAILHGSPPTACRFAME